MVDNVPNRSIKKVGVLGAGLMGHGITHTVAISGLEVAMIDTSMEKLKYALVRIRIGDVLTCNGTITHINQTERGKLLKVELKVSDQNNDKKLIGHSTIVVS